MLSHLEPEVMDTPEEARKYDAMDHSHVNQIFVRDFLQVWNQRSPILDIGTGTAQIPIEFCRQSSIGELVGIDLADWMLTLGRMNITHQGLEHRIRLELENARAMTYATDSFGAIMSNSIIHHIPEPRLAFAEMDRVAAPGATLFVRDLLRPSTVEILEQLVQTYAGSANSEQQQLFRQSLHAALDLDEVRAMVAELGYPKESVQATSDRHWTWSVSAK